jgi:hypothetical protein
MSIFVMKECIVMKKKLLAVTFAVALCAISLVSALGTRAQPQESCGPDHSDWLCGYRCYHQECIDDSYSVDTDVCIELANGCIGLHNKACCTAGGGF